MRSLKQRGWDCQSDCCCARELDLEEPDGVDLADDVEDALVIEWQLVEVGPCARGLLDEFEALRDRRERAQPEQVHLDEPEVLDIVLVELHDDAARHGRALHRHDVDERLAGDEHAAHMDTQMPGGSLDPTEDVDVLQPRLVGHADGRVLSSREPLRPGFREPAGPAPPRDATRPRGACTSRCQHGLHVGHVPTLRMCAELVDERLRKAHRQPHLTDRHAWPEGDDVGDHPGAVRAVFLVHVLQHLLAMVGGEIDVDVGRSLVVLMQESLEEQVVRDGIDTRDAEQVRDDGVGRTAASLSGNAALAGEPHDVPRDQEELRKVRLLDDVELALQTCRDDARHGVVFALHRLLTEAVQHRERRLPCGYRVAREAHIAEVERHFA